MQADLPIPAIDAPRTGLLSHSLWGTFWPQDF
jgi:hypothetical protein